MVSDNGWRVISGVESEWKFEFGVLVAAETGAAAHHLQYSGRLPGCRKWRGKEPDCFILIKKSAFVWLLWQLDKQAPVSWIKGIWNSWFRPSPPGCWETGTTKHCFGVNNRRLAHIALWLVCRLILSTLLVFIPKLIKWFPPLVAKTVKRPLECRFNVK